MIGRNNDKRYLILELIINRCVFCGSVYKLFYHAKAQRKERDESGSRKGAKMQRGGSVLSRKDAKGDLLQETKSIFEPLFPGICLLDLCLIFQEL